jgi:dihydrolipoamide dehydrogenase
LRPVPSAEAAVAGVDLPGVETSDGIFAMREVPQVLVTVGAGAVGVEFAYLFHELGSKSILVEGAAQVLPSEDPAIGGEMDRLLRGYGIEIKTSRKLKRIEREREGARLRVAVEGEGGEEIIEADRVLLALGRAANVESLDLDAAGIERDKKGAIVVDENLATNVGGVYAVGDCIRSVGWAHQAAGEGTTVAEALAGRAPSIDRRFLPSCYYTHPEIASVGATEKKAREEGKDVRVGRFYFRSNGRAAAAGEHEGFVQIVVEEGSERLLGCQIIGPRATELINEVVVALKNGSTVDELVGAVHAHPTFAEALPEAALEARAARAWPGGAATEDSGEDDR